MAIGRQARTVKAAARNTDSPGETNEGNRVEKERQKIYTKGQGRKFPMNAKTRMNAYQHSSQEYTQKTRTNKDTFSISQPPTNCPLSCSHECFTAHAFFSCAKPRKQKYVQPKDHSNIHDLQREGDMWRVAILARRTYYYVMKRSDGIHYFLEFARYN